MKKKFIGVTAALAVGLPLMIVLLYLAYMTVTDFRPKAALDLEIRNNPAAHLGKGVPFSVLAFNIGYCGLDAGELVLFNLHLSVFDQGGRIRRQQLAYLKERLLAEYQNGNHVIAGGDWNYGLPGSDPVLFKAAMPRPAWYIALPPGLHAAGIPLGAGPDQAHGEGQRLRLPAGRELRRGHRRLPGVRQCRGTERGDPRPGFPEQRPQSHCRCLCPKINTIQGKSIKECGG